MYLLRVDLHVTTAKQIKNFKKQYKRNYSCILASGIDPKKSIIFNQSLVPAHAELLGF